MRLPVILSLLATLPAAPARAQSTFGLPSGCSAHVTVQKRNCVVSHHFTCEADPEGHRRRVDLRESGMVYMGVIDAETQWIESFSPGIPDTDRLRAGAADPASFSELLDTGHDTWNFFTESDRGYVARHSGFDRLTGEIVTIDGVTLEVTEFEAVVHGADGAELRRLQGREFISRDWRTFLSGTRTITYPDGEVVEVDNRPVEFVFPGEPGFLAQMPRYDCGVVTSQLGNGLLSPEQVFSAGSASQ